jgi:hypothetical protein
MPLGAFTRGRPLGAALIGAVGAALLLWPLAASAADAPPAFTSGPTIQGDAVVGATLEALVTFTGTPTPTVKYTWRRCPATGGACVAITGATAPKYVVSAADVGFRLGVRVQLKNTLDTVSASSVTTAIVVTAPPPQPTPDPPPPPPTPDPYPAPPVTPTDAASSSAASATSAAGLAAAPKLLRPFPVVRIRGYFVRGGARITLLSVKGPSAARISARCFGHGCPKRALTRRGAKARLHPFERFLPAGTILQVRVTSATSIGKYVSFRIRARRAPLRHDRCLMPGGSKPVGCPAR